MSAAAGVAAAMGAMVGGIGGAVVSGVVSFSPKIDPDDRAGIVLLGTGAGSMLGAGLSAGLLVKDAPKQVGAAGVGDLHLAATGGFP